MSLMCFLLRWFLYFSIIPDRVSKNRFGERNFGCFAWLKLECSLKVLAISEFWDRVLSPLKRVIS